MTARARPSPIDTDCHITDEFIELFRGGSRRGTGSLEEGGTHTGGGGAHYRGDTVILGLFVQPIF